jgi:probable HAF family extracellular repeat protein
LAGHLATKGTSFVTLGTPGGAALANAASSGEIRRPSALGVSSAPRYFIAELGTLGGSESFAYAINDRGQVVGESRLAGDASTHSFLYSNGKMSDLYPLNSQGMQTPGPTGINNFGQIASGVIAGGVYVPAVLNTQTGQLSVIGSLGGVSFGFNGVAEFINNLGSVVGYSYIDSVNRHAFLYKDGVFADIGSFGGYSVATAINDAGVIVGFASDLYNGVAHAFVFANGAMTDIHSTTESYAEGVNSHGEVVGEFLTDDGKSFHAFLYSQGSFTDIGVSDVVGVSAINDQSQIVGIAGFASGQHAFLYQNGALFDLNAAIPQDFGWEVTSALGINNVGQIAGYGVFQGKYRRAFVLTPATSPDQCMDSGWTNFGFPNLGRCIQFVITGK